MNRLYKSLSVLITSGILLLSACSMLPQPSSKLSVPATVTFAISNETSEYYKTKVAEFKEIEPNITVELKTNSSQDIDVREIGWIGPQSGNEETVSQALDLTPFIQQEKDFNRDDFYPGLLDAYSRDGKQLALPVGAIPFVLFYNQDLFDNHGIPYPSADLTWDEFKTIAMQLRDPAAGVYGYLPMDTYVDAIFFSFTHGAMLLDGNQPQLDSIEAIETLEWYATLFSTLGAAPNAAQVDQEFGSGGIYAAIYRGMGGMWIADFTQIARFNSDRIQFKVGIAPLPRDENNLTVTQFEGLVISSRSKSPEAAWRWVRFLSSRPRPWSVPARRSVAESEQFSALIGKDQANIARGAVQNSRMINSFDLNLFQPVMNAYLSAVAQTVDGMLPAADTLREAQKKVSP